jgi:hypothetical protein
VQQYHAADSAEIQQHTSPQRIILSASCGHSSGITKLDTRPCNRIVCCRKLVFKVRETQINENHYVQRAEQSMFLQGSVTRMNLYLRMSKMRQI